METLAAENHLQWQVELGTHLPDRLKKNDETDWRPRGLGCLVHARLVVTSGDVWAHVAAQSRDWKSDLIVRLGQNDYPCALGYEDKERNLAAVVLGKPATGEDGQQIRSFPTLAEAPPNPGQALGILALQYLSSLNSSSKEGAFLCYTYGYVSLLRSTKEDATLFGLSGLVSQPTYLGSAIFDAGGKIYGLATDFVKPTTQRHFDEVQGGYLVFAPIYNMAKAVERLALAEAKL